MAADNYIRPYCKNDPDGICDICREHFLGWLKQQNQYLKIDLYFSIAMIVIHFIMAVYFALKFLSL